MILPVSSSILRDRRGYDAALERFSSAIAPFVDAVLGNDRDLTVRNDTAYRYRTFDATHLVEYTCDRLRDAINVDLAEELGFLGLFDRALEGLQRVVDLPDRRDRELVQLVLQNDGRLSARKRDRLAELTHRPLYGPGDNFDLQSSHVLPALIRKAVEAKNARARSLTIWGTGTPRPELLYVDDLADACLFLLEHVDEAGPINVGPGEDVTIRELAALVCEVVGYERELVFDASQPDGTPRKLMDVSRLARLGWTATTSLEVSVGRTVAWFVAPRAHIGQADRSAPPA